MSKTRVLLVVSTALVGCGSSPKHAEMVSNAERGSIVTLICDGGDRYASTYYSDTWVDDQGLELALYRETLETFLESGAFPAS